MPGRAAAGAMVLKSMDVIFFPPFSEMVMCPPYPPMPHRDGVATQDINAAATAASIAFPP
jgi:hypothetical protein